MATTTNTPNDVILVTSPLPLDDAVVQHATDTRLDDKLEKEIQSLVLTASESGNATEEASSLGKLVTQSSPTSRPFDSLYQYLAFLQTILEGHQSTSSSGSGRRTRHRNNIPIWILGANNQDDSDSDKAKKDTYEIVVRQFAAGTCQEVITIQIAKSNSNAEEENDNDKFHDAKESEEDEEDPAEDSIRIVSVGVRGGLPSDMAALEAAHETMEQKKVAAASASSPIKKRSPRKSDAGDKPPKMRAGKSIVGAAALAAIKQEQDDVEEADDPMEIDDHDNTKTPTPKRKRGRPKGSKNKTPSTRKKKVRTNSLGGDTMEDGNDDDDYDDDNNIGDATQKLDREAQWNALVDKLATYKAEHGDCNVPALWPADPSLSSWVKNLRSKYNKGKLAPDRIKQLESMGFVWRLSRVGVRSWDEQYKRLVAYEKTFGHCIVPVIFPEDQPLSSWVRRQRDLYRHSKLDDDKMEKLRQLGFDVIGTLGGTGVRHYRQRTAPPSRDGEGWNNVFERLKAYQQEHGNCNVPRFYHEDLHMAKWVSVQRMAYHQGKLKDYQIEKLESIGFEWKRARRWMDSYKLLKEFYDTYGHCDVPYEHDQMLAGWVRRQQRSKQDYERRTDEQNRLLAEIGFDFHGHKNKSPLKDAADLTNNSDKKGPNPEVVLKLKYTRMQKQIEKMQLTQKRLQQENQELERQVMEASFVPAAAGQDGVEAAVAAITNNTNINKGPYEDDENQLRMAKIELQRYKVKLQEERLKLEQARLETLRQKTKASSGAAASVEAAGPSQLV